MKKKSINNYMFSSKEDSSIIEMLSVHSGVSVPVIKKVFKSLTIVTALNLLESKKKLLSLKIPYICSIDIDTKDCLILNKQTDFYIVKNFPKIKLSKSLDSFLKDIFISKKDIYLENFLKDSIKKSIVNILSGYNEK